MKILELLIVLVGIGFLIRSWSKASKKRKEEESRREAAEWKKENLWKKEQREQEEARWKKIAEKRHCDFLEAQARGDDVCPKCETINPKRCGCSRCISSYKCDEYYYSRDECEACYEKRKRKECAEAEKDGIDVCWKCLTVRPDRCYCRNCTSDKCYGGGGGECNLHSD